MRARSPRRGKPRARPPEGTAPSLPLNGWCAPMPHTNPFELLATEHELLRRQLGRALTSAGAPARKAPEPPPIDALVDALRIHFRREERALFPLCERIFGGPESAVGVLHDEHVAIDDALGPIARGSLGPKETSRALEEVVGLLERHLAREEKVLFPLAQSRMTQAEAGFLAKRLRGESSR